MTPEEQLHMMQLHEERLREMQSEPSTKDLNVSMEFAVNIHSRKYNSPLTFDFNHTEVHVLRRPGYLCLGSAPPATWTSQKHPAPLTS